MKIFYSKLLDNYGNINKIKMAKNTFWFYHNKWYNIKNSIVIVITTRFFKYNILNNTTFFYNDKKH